MVHGHQVLEIIAQQTNKKMEILMLYLQILLKE